MLVEPSSKTKLRQSAGITFFFIRTLGFVEFCVVQGRSHLNRITTGLTYRHIYFIFFIFIHFFCLFILQTLSHQSFTLHILNASMHISLYHITPSKCMLIRLKMIETDWKLAQRTEASPVTAHVIQKKIYEEIQQSMAWARRRRHETMCHILFVGKGQILSVLRVYAIYIVIVQVC